MAMTPTLEQRLAALHALTSNLGLEITRMVKWLTDRPTFTVWVDQDRVELGTVDTLLSQRKFRSRVAEVIGRLPNWIHERDWDSAVAHMLQACEWLEVPTTTQAETVTLWLSYYLDRYRPTHRHDGDAQYEAAVRNRAPIQDARGIWISLEDLRAFVNNEIRERGSRAELGTALTSHGATTDRISVGNRETRVQRRYWLLPAALLPEELIPEEVTL